jgi:hypothetical protein
VERSASCQHSRVLVDFVNVFDNILISLLCTFIVPFFLARDIINFDMAESTNHLDKVISSHACMRFVVSVLFKYVHLLSTVNGGIEIITREHSHSHFLLSEILY